MPDAEVPKLVLGIDYTIEAGLYVFTAAYHLKRGSCCQNGCRYCPYGNAPPVSPPAQKPLSGSGLPAHAPETDDRSLPR